MLPYTGIDTVAQGRKGEGMPKFNCTVSVEKQARGEDVQAQFMQGIIADNERQAAQLAREMYARQINLPKEKIHVTGCIRSR